MKKFSEADIYYMQRCLQLARCGSGSTSPNPMVGAVIVCDGRIIGEGYHIRAGEPHAEVNAVRSVKECDRELLQRSTIYVSLEPCSHHGKTPPCCDLIISCGMKRVVIATTDFNAQVNGEGIARMQRAGIEVVTGLLSDEAQRLNSGFFTLHRLNRPCITLKWAETADGFIDRRRSSIDDGAALAISTPGSMVAVHKLRAQCDAILVGTRTALLDNPSLTVRRWAGRNPLRLVIDKENTLPASLRLFNDEARTVVYTYNVKDGEFGKNVEQVALTEGGILEQIIQHLASLKVNSLIVEGGAALLQSFIDAGLWDTARVERNPLLAIGNGVAAPVLPKGVRCSTEKLFGNEILSFYA
ncbi:MAG: bifunctional diaminohydroxyphosphoribosylaminopyrimidine deaminase/5-amino-6-(5-phosphoribosylamino)uracil reductase RibD [Bacteroidaceae bacterium]|nr:bifunctional diaminohydroxyphosphoribosylaminopyrimidine deaminase/5-amino-6-(5-phosphoribosylamino)uracil reductase RibD [Bacteroidaceae bacterium]